jgi:hypothetical protein
MPLWFKKKNDEKENMENMSGKDKEIFIFNERRDLKKALERICFDMLDIDGNGVIDIVDLMQLCSHFHFKKEKTQAEKELTAVDIEGIPKIAKDSDEEDCVYHLALGKQVHEMFAKYETENLKPGWEPVTFKYDFETYKK